MHQSVTSESMNEVHTKDYLCTDKPASLNEPTTSESMNKSHNTDYPCTNKPASIRNSVKWRNPRNLKKGRGLLLYY